MLKVPDVNVLVSAVHAQTPGHRRARAWVEDSFSGPHTVGLAWLALIGFIRISTRRGIFEDPLPVESALAVVHAWLAQPNATVLAPGERHAALLSSLLMGAGTAGNLTNDAHLAALALEHGATLASFDRDFQRFAGLRHEALTP